MCGINQVIKKLPLSVFLGLLLLVGPLKAQEVQKNQEPQKKEKKQKKKKPQLIRNPKTATLFSIIPGGGQIYNHKYWKAPIVYAGFAVFGYFIVTNTQQYHIFRDAYNSTADSATTNPYALKYSPASLRIVRDYYRRNMQLSYILTGAWYILQMVDANVDAHLTRWNISDNLSMEVAPVISPPLKPRTGAYNGLSIRFRF
jgi:hypothetical protein